MPNIPSRQHDETVLRVIAMRMGGASLAEVRAAIGMQASGASKAVTMARIADISQCAFWGDDPAAVAQAWRAIDAGDGRRKGKARQR